MKKKKKSSQRLNNFQRRWIEMLYNEKKSYHKIAKTINKSHSTVMREIKRNSCYIDGLFTYNADFAIKNNDIKLHKSRTRKIENCKFLQDFIYAKLQLTWSPDSISGYLKNNKPKYYISHETIYSYIYNQREEWIQYLYKAKKRRNRRYNKYRKRVKTRILHRISIDDRPDYVNNRTNIGHFEADTIVSRKSKHAILVLHERKSKKTFIKKLERKMAIFVKEKIINTLKKYSSILKTITYDNGTENVLHYEVNEALGCKSYFCNPYHSWEKGSIEHVNGLIRRFIPKKTDLSKITQNELDRIQDLINNRPRKSLNYLSPKICFDIGWCNQT
jgi:IS30 family transposase